MGQTITKLTEKYTQSDDSFDCQESRGIMHDVTIDEDIVYDNNHDSVLDKSIKTPPNIVKLKNDPRSPSCFNRTPLKLPVDDEI